MIQNRECFNSHKYNLKKLCLTHEQVYKEEQEQEKIAGSTIDVRPLALYNGLGARDVSRREGITAKHFKTTTETSITSIAWRCKGDA